MKQVDLIRRIHSYGCILFREGGKHSGYKNTTKGTMTAVPRHRENKESLAPEDL